MCINHPAIKGVLPFMETPQCGAPKIAKLVYNSNFTMVYGTQIDIVFMVFMGVYKPTWLSNGGHIYIYI